MARKENYEDIEIYMEEGGGEPLIPDDADCGEGQGVFVYDEEGELTSVAPVTAMPGTLIPRLPEQPAIPWPELVALTRPCSLKTLNGSWLLQLVPKRPHLLLSQIRGPMRIEADSHRLRVSGDVYVRPPFLIARPVIPEIGPALSPGSVVIKLNWYPAFPQSQYRWYFRSTGVSYTKSGSQGRLFFKFERHLWNTTTEEFTSSDRGWMELSCSTSLIRPVGWPQPTIEMTGEAMIGGYRYDVTATKTSPYYRGCLVEVDVMRNRSWPASAQSCDGSRTFSFTGVYRDAGLDFGVVVDEVDVPEDPLLTIAELHSLLATHRSLSPAGDKWRVWVLVGSRMDGTLGIMFDTANPPHREGAVGFYDPTLPNISIIQAAARGKKLGEVELAFLRTLIHEAGHTFNLYHPKHDVHGVATGTTIMNQTGDVMGFATTSNPYPCNATMAFNDHNRTSLIHSPDPQVKPAWKQFGWGHGSAWSGVAEPVDALGLDVGAPVAEWLRLEVELPKEAHRGEFIMARATVTNVGDSPHQVTAALNLAEGDLRMTVTDPSGQANDVRDVVLVCSDRRLVELQPGKSITGNVQLFYTSRGFTFDQPGRYVVRAELDVGDVEGSVVRSDPVDVLIRPATSEEERDLQGLTMDEDVGLSLAFGDFGAETATQEKLTNVMDRFSDTDTGAACAMVLANSLARDFRDVRTDQVIRAADEAEKDRALDIALEGRDAFTIADMASAVVSPRETTAPLLDQVQTRLKKARKGTYKKEDLEQADKIFSDHLA